VGPPHRRCCAPRATRRGIAPGYRAGHSLGPRELRIPRLAFRCNRICMSLPPVRQVAELFDATPPDV